MKRFGMLVCLLLVASAYPTVADAQSNRFGIWNGGQGLQNFGRAPSYGRAFSFAERQALRERIRYRPLPASGFTPPRPEREQSLEEQFPTLFRSLQQSRDQQARRRAQLDARREMLRTGRKTKKKRARRATFTPKRAPSSWWRPYVRRGSIVDQVIGKVQETRNAVERVTGPLELIPVGSTRLKALTAGVKALNSAANGDWRGAVRSAIDLLPERFSWSRFLLRSR